MSTTLHAFQGLILQDLMMCCSNSSLALLYWSVRALASRLYMRPFLAAATAMFFRLIWQPHQSPQFDICAVSSATGTLNLKQTDICILQCMRYPGKHCAGASAFLGTVMIAAEHAPSRTGRQSLPSHDSMQL